MGWGEAAAHQRKRLEEEDRARVLAWEAANKRKRPGASGLATSSASSFRPSPPVHFPTRTYSSQSYQGQPRTRRFSGVICALFWP